MWIIQEPKKVALRNKRHFEGKNGECTACLKYSVLYLLKKYIKCNIWRAAVRPSCIWDAQFLKVKVIKQTHNWKSPGLDKLQHFWVKWFFVIPEGLTRALADMINPLAYTDVPETAGLTRSINTQPAVRRNSETNPTSQHNRGMYWRQN